MMTKLRRSAILSAFLAIAIAAAAQDITLKATDRPAAEVFRSIMQQTDRNFVYSSELLKNMRITLDLKDHEETADFHRLTYRTFEPDTEGEIWTETRSASSMALLGGSFDPLDSVFYQQVDPFEDVMYGSYYLTFFSDILYNGEVKPLTFGFSDCRFTAYGWNGDSADLECGWDITLYSISESYYNWLAYDEQQEGAIFGDMADFGLAEPIWGYSNVSTGTGVVAAQSSTTVSINLRHFLEETLTTSNLQLPSR